MNCKIAVLKGDGIGPEVIDEAIKVLKAIEQKYSHSFEFEYGLIGGAAIDKTDSPLPDETKKILDNCSAVLLGAVGGDKWKDVPRDKRPEKGLLDLRKHLEVYGNLRTVKLFKSNISASPLKNEIIKDGVDICIVRELLGGIYFGERGKEIIDGITSVYDVERYSRPEIERIARLSFDIAMQRNKKVTSVDKANVLESSLFWRSVVEDIAKEYPDIELNHLYVDNAAMQLIINPTSFDVVLTNNIFGDILSDEASVLSGSIGMLPSASLGAYSGLYEPSHGSAPDIAGTNIANPIATILSAAMLLKYSFNLEKEAKEIEEAVEKVLSSSFRTKDIYTAESTLVSTCEMGDLIVKNL